MKNKKKKENLFFNNIYFNQFIFSLKLVIVVFFDK
jgi:hypothetical protein